jgi:small subunit ribosomal protein S17|uniref:ribosomal protein S17 n=1 Tax=Fibrocapsa japonica TaxID=94617 RepID=UPI0021149976|nr:ribosomal protein S17 [Fibrocapsa japonica]UTE95150.1 ribosomal protein S17 [Fibrocapsa japonica]
MAVKEKIGIVISNKMTKTIVIAVENRYKSPIYSKIKISTKQYLVHDEFNECNVGDKIIVKESRPLSKKKRWVLKKIIDKASFFK